ncbi:gas vesicle protein GvpK [Patiriisocius marinus]|uniref:gas vesicle protein GvpK n=1 Tax=Patiriisocius marinus TaxID=1397112 RepID=UPI00232F91E4|nr:gas vesicle protein GvpK [Patiriisocius marinus]
MKLLFNKEDNNDITVKIQQGTVPVEFTYTEMIKQLLENNTIDDTDFGNLSDDEKENLEDMLNKISEIFNEEEEDEQEIEQESE